MKKPNLPAMIALLLMCLMPVASFAAVEINGTAINEITLNGEVITNMQFTQNGDKLTITTSSSNSNCADPDAVTCPGSDAFCAANPTDVSCPGSEAFCEANPSHASCPGSAAFCAANPTHVSCPGSVAFCEANPTHASCQDNGCSGNAPVLETLNWGALPVQFTTKVVTGVTGVASEFVTTGSTSFNGRVLALADTGSAGLTWSVWISECPGDEKPLVQMKTIRGVSSNVCAVSGAEPTLYWTQANSASQNNQCILERNKKYYLNYKQERFSKSPTASSAMYRTMAHN